MNGVIGIAGVLTILLVLGLCAALLDRRNFHWKWLVGAAVLVLLNDAVLTRIYGQFPDVMGGEWNWQGKVLALLLTLSIAALPAFGWANCGMRLAQRPGSLKPALSVAAIYCAFFLAVALAFPGEPANAETIAFQATLPGMEEELFYRGLLLFALDRAFTGRWQFAGVEWGWGAMLSCILFGLAHAFSFSNGAFGFDALAMALTAVPALLAVWLRLRTGSLLIPIVLHNLGNSLFLLV